MVTDELSSACAACPFATHPYAGTAHTTRRGQCASGSRSGDARNGGAVNARGGMPPVAVRRSLTRTAARRTPLPTRPDSANSGHRRRCAAGRGMVCGAGGIVAPLPTGGLGGNDPILSVGRLRRRHSSAAPPAAPPAGRTRGSGAAREKGRRARAEGDRLRPEGARAAVLGRTALPILPRRGRRRSDGNIVAPRARASVRHVAHAPRVLPRE